jgi:hypothetical protein
MPEGRSLSQGEEGTEEMGIVSRTGFLVVSLGILTALVLLFWISTINYLTFHILVEFVSIVIGYCIFAFTITSRKILDGYLVIIGIGFFFFGSIDLLHTLAYKGMGLFTQDANIAT